MKRARPKPKDPDKRIHAAAYWAELFCVPEGKITDYCKAYSIPPERVTERQAYTMLDYMLSHVKEYFSLT